MEVDRDLILNLEQLAQLELSEEERILLQKDLENIIEMVDKLQEIDTNGLESLVHLGNDNSIVRQDLPGIQLTRSESLSNASVQDGQYFLVPKVIEK